MNEETLKIVKDFDRLPETEEKNEIIRKYLNDEIGSFEFFSLANSYLNNQQAEAND